MRLRATRLANTIRIMRALFDGDGFNLECQHAATRNDGNGCDRGRRRGRVWCLAPLARQQRAAMTGASRTSGATRVLLRTSGTAVVAISRAHQKQAEQPREAPWASGSAADDGDDGLVKYYPTPLASTKQESG
ncbi:hypothetical protein EVAR_96091_1 [Eumeta japonica]|uniref:Uncharacterized protein n=1 Tax=Eumeta variegata TaxID=151549 RepID=A0A4C1VGK3_EUMVA|nr:hypothetical protein EVAR_96091_1 [Eumeta japonica]